MPFTPAHTVAVLPFVRSGKVSSTALVTGSMSPDFEYFIRMDVLGEWGHDIPGIFLFDLPVTVALVFIFHTVVKGPLIDNLPVFLQRRFARLKQLSAREDILDRPLTFAFCACVGAATHICWDGFTHGSGYFVGALPGLYKGVLVPVDGVNYPLWYFLQYLSTAVGLIVLIIYIFLMKPATGQVESPGIGYWLGLMLITGMVTTVRLQFPHIKGFPMIVISMISGLCLGVIILGLFAMWRKRSAETRIDG